MNCPSCDTYCEPGTVQCECGYVFIDPPELEDTSRRTRTYRTPRSSRRFSEFLKFLLLIVILAFGITHFLRKKLPAGEEIDSRLLREPLQFKKRVPGPFTVTRKGISYTVAPLYRYQLFGLVVSYHHSGSFLDIHHERWKDYLNVKDLCVIWGDNIRSEGYLDICFTSNDYTCHYRWPDAATRRLFSPRHLSNNHLIAADPEIIRKIMSTRRGDQVHIRGYLSRYSHTGSRFNRGTSTTRTDTGDGACETIYVTGYEILHRNRPLVYAIYRFSLWGGILLVILLLLNLHRSSPREGV